MDKDIEKAAKKAQALLSNTTFIETIKDLRNDQMLSFANSSANETEQREDAHAILRALKSIEYSLQADVDAMTLIERKGKHRGND